MGWKISTTPWPYETFSKLEKLKTFMLVSLKERLFLVADLGNTRSLLSSYNMVLLYTVY